MGPLKNRLQIIALSSVLVPSAIGVVAVHASPTCDHVVRTYLTVPVRNQVSKATAIAWAKWRVGHPDWKPNPRVTRPKYKMTRQEAVRKVEQACEVPVTPAVMDLALTPTDVAPPPTSGAFPRMDSGQMLFPDVVPPEVAEIPPASDTPFTSGASPLFPAAPGGGVSGGIPGLPGTGIVIPVPPTTTGVPTTGTTVPPPIDTIPVVPPPVVAATPEPSSFLLLATGLAGVGLCLKKRAEFAMSKI